MAYRLDPFADVGLTTPLLELLIAEHERLIRPRLEHLWRWYRNPAQPRSAAASGPSRHRLAQEAGLPARFQPGHRDVSADDRAADRRETVVENDIGWRLQAMVDFMFGKPVSIVSTARDETDRRTIQSVLEAVWEGSGGIALLQDLALLGHVYGHADLLLRIHEGDPAAPSRRLPTSAASLTPTPPPPADPASLADAAARFARIELIEPTRGIPVLDPSDYRRLHAYIIHFDRELNAVDRAGLIGWRSTPRRRRSCRTEIVSATAWQVYEDGALTDQGLNPWTPGEVPVVHIQNTSEPFRYSGVGEVEPLIPLQDELNTRLSDRAARVTMQSFKMYLARGIDGFDRFPIGPGQIISTDNPDASIEAFGGDGQSPSEERHIQEIREALDKTSGVPPLASGVVRARIGNLSSANALRITLMGVLSKTARKRITYGGGIARMCRLILTALDQAGILKTDPADRAVRLVWPDPLPEDLHEQTLAAKAKSDLGVPRERVLAELGYSGADPGIQ
jgi:hypothetical protein